MKGRRTTMPRRSVADQNVIPLGVSARHKLTPIGTLTRAERKVFDRTVRENGHLKRADIPLLELFAIACCRTAAAKRKDPKSWQRESRVVISYGTKLRITQQAKIEPRSAARAQPYSGDRKPWERGAPDEDDK